MSRSGYGYDDDGDPLAHGRYRAAVRSAFLGKRGQAFLKEMLAALDAMPDKRLIREHLKVDGDQCRFGDPDIIVGADELCTLTGTSVPMGAVCALGAVGSVRGMDMSHLDPHEAEDVASAFGIAESMAREIVDENDDGGGRNETPEQRWVRMRAWVERHIKVPA